MAACDELDSTELVAGSPSGARAACEECNHSELTCGEFIEP